MIREMLTSMKSDPCFEFNNIDQFLRLMNMAKSEGLIEEGRFMVLIHKIKKILINGNSIFVTLGYNYIDDSLYFGVADRGYDNTIINLSDFLIDIREEQINNILL